MSILTFSKSFVSKISDSDEFETKVLWKLLLIEEWATPERQFPEKKTVQSCYDVIGKQQIINGIINSAETVFVKSAQKGWSVEIWSASEIPCVLYNN